MRRRILVLSEQKILQYILSTSIYTLYSQEIFNWYMIYIFFEDIYIHIFSHCSLMDPLYMHMFNNMICVLKIYYIPLEYTVNVLNLAVYLFCFA